MRRLLLLSCWWIIISGLLLVTRAESAPLTVATTTYPAELVPRMDDVEPQHHHNKNNHLVPIFLPAVYLSLSHLLLNVLRPTPLRVSRLVWEVSLLGLLMPTTVHARSLPLLRLVSVVTASTALVDLFVWTPVYAMWASCKQDRQWLVVQSILGGLVYLYTALATWHETSKIVPRTRGHEDRRRVQGDWEVNR